jgi:hypothetical protein
MLRQILVPAVLILSAAACSDGSPTETERAASTSQGLAPAGSDAAFVATTMKASWYPGERGVMSVTLRNTGDLAGTNDWTVNNPKYALGSQDNEWDWHATGIQTPVIVGDTYTFSFPVTAPAVAGAHTFSARMRVPGFGYFGDLVANMVTVSTLTVPEWNCTFLPGASDLPGTLTPGENRMVTVTVQNSGSGTWVDGFALVARDMPRNLWSETRAPIVNSVAAGATTSWSFRIRAPLASGNYRFQREMFDSRPGRVGLFHESAFCVDTPISVAGTNVLDAALVSQNFPSIMAPGEPFRVTVDMKNPGSETWQANGNYVMASLNTPLGRWGITPAPVTSTTGMGATASVSFVVTAPTTPGSYVQKCGMSKLVGTNAGPFGPAVEVPIVVSGSAIPGYGATVTSQSVPAQMTPGQTYPVSIVMKNVGSNPWQGATFGLASVNKKTGLWGTILTPLAVSDQIASGAEHTFTFSVKAPTTPGSYASAWRMTQLGGAGPFGQLATTSDIAVGGTPHDCTELFASNTAAPNGIYQIDIDGTGPTAPFDVYCDMTNGGWTQVNDQDVAVGAGFLTNATWLAGVNTTAPNGGQWGVLNHLSAFVRNSGGYELRLTYGQDESRSARWVQSGDPTSATRGTLSNLVMTPANQVGCGVFSGLASDGGPAAIDGNTGGCWWFAVGSNTGFGGGIPAYEGSAGGSLVTDRVRLYVRR